MRLTDEQTYPWRDSLTDKARCACCQHYYLAYQEAAKKARAARYSMTRAIRRKMLSEAEE